MDIRELKAIFSDRLMGLLAEKEMTSADFSRAINIPDNTLANYKNCHRAIQIDNLVKIAEFFGVTTDYLLGIEDRFSK